MTTQYSKDTVNIVEAGTNLREALESRGSYKDLQMVMRHLFAGNAQVETDNLGQVVVYTGYTFGSHSDDVMTLDADDYGFPKFWCKND
mgnify:CR=1 FL=1